MKLTPEQIQQQLRLLGREEKSSASGNNSSSSSGSSDNNTNISLEEIEAFGNKDSLREMLIDISKYNKMLAERITLINEPLTATIPFTRENLYLFCAYTGSGKSTVAANISFPLWKQKKKTLVLSNEESQHDILFRIGCLELGYSFNDYKKGNMPMEQQKQVIYLFPDISKYVKVIDVTYKNGLTTKVEGIKKALEAVKKEDSYSCVLIDYFQLIKYSLTDPRKTAYENLNDLRIWLGQYIKGSTMPVVLLAQLYSMSKRGGAKDIDARIKDCSAIVEPATVIVEVIPDFEASTTSFLIHKDRFGRAGRRIECGFDKGRYVKLTQDELIKRKNQVKKTIQEEKLDKLENTLQDIEE